MKILSDASIYLGANIINAAIPFFLLPILTRVLTPAEYGTVAMFEAVVVLLGVFTGLSVHGAVGVRYYKEDQTTFPEYVGVCLYILTGSTLITAAILVVGEPFLLLFTGLNLDWLLLAVLVSFAQFLANIRLVIWQVGRQALRYGAFQILQTALNAMVSLFLVLYLAWGSAGRITGFSFAVITFGVFALMSMQNNGWIKWKWNREYFRDAINFGLPLIPHVFGGIAVGFADRFIITKKLGVDETGLYFVAMQLAMPLVVLGSSFNRAFVPWLYEKLSNKQNAQAVLVSYIVIIGLLFFGLLYGLFVGFGLSLIVGEKYQQAKLIALILIAGTSFQAAYYAVVNYIFYAQKTNYLSAITLITGTLYMVGAWMAVPNYGLIGVAILFTIVQGMTFILIWFASSKINPQPWLEFSLLRNTLQNFLNSNFVKN